LNPETNPYIPAAGSRPPVLAGREEELDAFTVAERIYMAAMADLGPGGHSSAEIAARMGLTVKTASVRRDGLLKKGLIYSRVDTELDFTVPQFATFIERIHPFDATQRLRRGRPPRKH
jgi:DNA-binding CsgD family transcriptional regulator